MRFAFASALLAACTTSSAPPTPTGPPPNVDPPRIACTVPRPIAQDAASPADAGDASADDAGDGGPDTNAADASPPSAPECRLPPATCADSNWLAYFDDGQCIDGKCLLTTKYHFCPSGCSNTAYEGAGGCNQPVRNGETAPAPPNRF